MSNVPTYPQLFILNNDRIYTWSISIIDKNKDGSVFTITTSHGLIDGKKVIHEKDIEEGKAKRTVLEQATLEANRKWENKKEKELYVEKLDLNADGKKSDKSPSSIVVRPMLANTFDPKLYEVTAKKSRAFKIDFPAYVQRKYDGIRCISYRDAKGNIIIESRKGIAFQNFVELKEQLRVLFDKLPENFYFDGELYTNDIPFEIVSGLIRLHEKKTTTSDLELINKIDYYIYDFVNLNELELPYKDRFAYLNYFIWKNTKKLNLIKQVETIIIETVQDVKTYHDKFVSEGYEGIMIRDQNGPYEVNKRSKYLQKFKEFMEEEFKITGYHDGTGDEKGAVVWECETKDKTPFAVRPRGTFEARKKLFNEAQKYIGKLITVIFQEYSSDGIPRFPVGKGIRDIY
jgi:ATP-dependent DNA ligase